MKRFVLFLSLFFYVFAVSGTALNLHFCANKLNGISFAGTAHKGCCCKKAKKPMKKGCCTDKHISFKLHTEHQSADKPELSTAAFKLLPAITGSVTIPSAGTVQTVCVPDFHTPPIRAAGTDLLLLYCIFRI